MHTNVPVTLRHASTKSYLEIKGKHVHGTHVAEADGVCGAPFVFTLEVGDAHKHTVTIKASSGLYVAVTDKGEIHTSAKRTEECHFSTHENESGDVAFTHTCHGQKHDLFVDAQGHLKAEHRKHDAHTSNHFFTVEKAIGKQ